MGAMVKGTKIYGYTYIYSHVIRIVHLNLNYHQRNFGRFYCPNLFFRYGNQRNGTSTQNYLKKIRGLKI